MNAVRSDHRITSVFPASGQNDIACNMRLVLDTDVVLSGLRSTVGASRILLLAIEAGVVTPLVSVATVIEYEAVLKRAEHLEASHLDVDDVDMFLAAFVAYAEASGAALHQPAFDPRFRTMRSSSRLPSTAARMRW